MTNSGSIGTRILLAGGFSALIAAAPAVAIFATAPGQGPAGPVVACPAGETEDIYLGECVPEMAPNVSGGTHPTMTPTGGGGITESTPGDANSVPEVQGVPCTGRNTGECIGLEENQVPVVQPRTSISSSP